jgi:hypothetical protein
VTHRPPAFKDRACRGSWPVTPFRRKWFTGDIASTPSGRGTDELRSLRLFGLNWTSARDEPGALSLGPSDGGVDLLGIHGPQQTLYLRPEPHGHGWLRPTLEAPAWRIRPATIGAWDRRRNSASHSRSSSDAAAPV